MPPPSLRVVSRVTRLHLSDLADLDDLTPQERATIRAALEAFLAESDHLLDVIRSAASGPDPESGLRYVLDAAVDHPGWTQLKATLEPLRAARTEPGVARRPTVEPT